MAIDYDQQFTGVVEKIGIWDIKEHIKNQRVASGEYKGEQFNIDKTHTVAFKIPELHSKWISIGHRKFREGYDLIFQIKKGDEYVNVWDGSTLTFMYAKNGEYLNVEGSSIRVLKIAECNQKIYTFGDKKSGGQNSGGSPKNSYDPIGPLQGNAFNGSMILLNNKSGSPKAVEIQIALKVINEEIKAQLPKVNGASIGMAILAACKEGKKIEKVKEVALKILMISIPDLEAAWNVSEPKTQETDQKSPQEPNLEGFDDSEIPF